MDSQSAGLKFLISDLHEIWTAQFLSWSTEPALSEASLEDPSSKTATSCIMTKRQNRSAKRDTYNPNQMQQDVKRGGTLAPMMK